MGLVYAELELVNGADVLDVRRNRMDQDEVKRIHVTALVDSGAYTTAINENIQEILQIPVVGQQTFFLANGKKVTCNIVWPLYVKFKNKEVGTRAIVLPGDEEVLLGAITMEDMAVIIDPLRRELVIPEGKDALPFHRLTSFKPFRKRSGR